MPAKPVRHHSEATPGKQQHLAWLAALLLAAALVHGLAMPPPVSRGDPHAA